MIGILGAIQVEVEALCKILEGCRTVVKGAITYHEGKIASKDVVVAHCRVGKVNAAMATEAMIQTYAPTWLINIGLAGAVAECINPFDLVIATGTVQHDFDTTAFGDALGTVDDGKIVFDCDEAGRSAFIKAVTSAQLMSYCGIIATGDQFIASWTKRQWLEQQFDAIACEMEGGAIMVVAYHHKIPCNVIRMISDRADESAQHSFDDLKAASIKQIELILPEAIRLYSEGTQV